jgi:hypothetical protein
MHIFQCAILFTLAGDYLLLLQQGFVSSALLQWDTSQLLSLVFLKGKM